MSATEAYVSSPSVSESSSAPVGGAAKRVFDVVLASLLLVFFAPILIVIALAVWISDPGPIFFGHTRIGYDGRRFKCLKFRSMVVNSAEALEKHLAASPAARAEWELTHKLKDDPRITGIGRLLRVSSLDELPQLLNVIRGEMSLVGPRPIVQEEVERYADRINFYTASRPGLTGLWQVSGRSDTSYAQRVELDSTYVQTWRMRNDVKILARTAVVVLKREGSC
ncbi:exopolysaccharide biosynthesis protein [Aureimonas endophytica]|uniref:Exopolysaccharide biosynthesis protein n=1 Tax=Aureimonas endophytica TaxID=2027858 RepID=A0A916ZKK0_9HYPH|nr:sugar transferase [Aureimonas endophytica]GGE01097.1 exopolysaccharide biosynthesis protein [Aureimonas endophytica]